MYVVLLCSLIALLFTYLETKGEMRDGMKWGFCLVAFIGAIHYDYGNDYMSYMDLYNDITSYKFDLKGILDGDYYREPGWALFCWLFKPIGGFYVMVAVLNIVQNLFIYNFIKNNVERIWWPISVFIYLFATSFFLMSFSMMRQFFVMTVFLGMWTFIKNRKWYIVVFIIYLCTYIHSSALILMPFAFWGFVPAKNGKIIGLSYIILLLTLWLFRDALDSMFQYAVGMDDTFSDYAVTYGDGGTKGLNVGIGFVINMIPFVLSIIFILSKNKVSVEAKQMVSLCAILYLITPFGQIIPLVGRLGMYFGIYGLGTVPLVYGNIKRSDIRKGLLFLYIIFVLYDYVKFFHSDVWIDKYTNFHTIFTHI